MEFKNTENNTEEQVNVEEQSTQPIGEQNEGGAQPQPEGEEQSQPESGEPTENGAQSQGQGGPNGGQPNGGRPYMGGQPGRRPGGQLLIIFGGDIRNLMFDKEPSFSMINSTMRTP